MTIGPRPDAAAALLAELAKCIAEGGALAGAVVGEAAAAADMPCLEVKAERVFDVARVLRQSPNLSFDQLTYVTATDESPDEPRFRVVYHFYSFAQLWRLRVVARVADGDKPHLPSLTALYMGANWMEREVFDMFGIAFDGHPELRRILMPEEYQGFPLRKDFPLEGIAPDRLYREWEKQAHAEGGGAHGA